MGGDPDNIDPDRDSGDSDSKAESEKSELWSFFLLFVMHL